MKSKIQTFVRARWPLNLRSAKSAASLCVVAMVIILLATKGIRDESVVSLNGDMPRYMMNGVYFYDFLRDLPISHPIAYTYQYFARYPALSLGHHPLLPGLAQVPFYAIFGVSVFSARLMTVCFMLLAGVAWFMLVRLAYNQVTAFLSAILFVTTPFIVGYSRLVMSEIPALALIIISTYYFYLYCQKNQRGHGYAFVGFLVLSLFARQQLVFMLPVFFSYFLIAKRPKVSVTRKTLISCLILALLLSPLIFITLKYSQTNVRWIMQKSLLSRLSLSNLLYYPKVLWKFHLMPPVLIFSVVSIGVSVYRRDSRALIFLLWIPIYYVLITLTGAKAPRYAIYWIPPFCLFAATIVSSFASQVSKVSLSCLLLVIAGYQFVTVFQSQLSYADGYEQAAKYVLEHKKGESVLFSANVDTGYFTFFVRKHDPHREAIVLRADKLLVTSSMRRIVETRISNRKQIYEILQDFGVGYVVIEDSPYRSAPLEWLREEVKSDRFILREKIPIRTNNRKLRNVALCIYEYKAYRPPEPGKVLDMNIPLMGDSIRVQFDNLLRKKH